MNQAFDPGTCGGCLDHADVGFPNCISMFRTSSTPTLRGCSYKSVFLTRVLEDFVPKQAIVMASKILMSHLGCPVQVRTDAEQDKCKDCHREFDKGEVCWSEYLAKEAADVNSDTTQAVSEP